MTKKRNFSPIKQLPFVPPPLPTELLHGWVMRISHSYFQTPQGLLKEVVLEPLALPALTFWGEPGRYFTDKRTPKKEMPPWWSITKALARLSQATGVDVTILRGMRPLMVCGDKCTAQVARSLKWVPVCPECLMQDFDATGIPFIRRDWSFPWISHCRVHRRLLGTRNQSELADLLALACYFRYLIPYAQMDHAVLRFVTLAQHTTNLPDESGPFEGELFDFVGTRATILADIEESCSHIPGIVWDLHTALCQDTGVSLYRLMAHERKFDKEIKKSSTSINLPDMPSTLLESLIIDTFLSLRVTFPLEPTPPIPILSGGQRLNLFELLGAILLQLGLTAHAENFSFWRDAGISDGRVAFGAHRRPLWTIAYGRAIGSNQMSFREGGMELRPSDRAIHSAILAGILRNARFRHRWRPGAPRKRVPILAYAVEALARGRPDVKLSHQNGPRSGIEVALALLRAIESFDATTEIVQQLSRKLASKLPIGARHLCDKQGFVSKGFRSSQLFPKPAPARQRRRPPKPRLPKEDQEEVKERIRWMPTMTLGRGREKDHSSPYFEAAERAINSSEGQQIWLKKRPGWQAGLMRLAQRFLEEKNTIK